MNVTSAQGMADILPPAPPDTSWWASYPELLFILPVILIAVFFWVRREPKPTVRRLQRLLKHHRSGNIDTRHSAQILSAELKQFFQLSHTSATNTPAGIDARHWADFIHQLHAIRFGRHDDEKSFEALTLQARQWITNYDR